MNDLQGGSNDIKMLAELLLKEVILAKKDNDFDFIEKPRKYVGSRDPHLIEAWIQSVEDYSELKGFDAKMMAKLGITLISGAAKVWFQNLRLLDSAPGEWLEFKTELRAYFKPENAMSVARDKMRNLRQTSSIAQYVQDFMTFKLSIPRMTDEEAVDKFISGIKDHAARIHIKDNIFMGNSVLGEAIRVAHIYEGNRQDSVPVSRGFSSSGDLQVDDPMDLSVAERRELYNMMKSSWNASGSNGFRGGYNGARGTSRGGAFRGGAQGGPNGFRGGRGGGQQLRAGCGGHARRSRDRYYNLQCHNCKGYGHFMRECPSPPRYQLNYAEAGDDNIDFDGNDFDNKDSDSSAYLYCVLPTFKSYVEPLFIDDSVIQKDLEFVSSAGRIDTKLPLYNALVNGHSCSVLIDSGASANYISPKLVSAVTQVRSVKGQAVETANGHQSAISSIATFSLLKLGDYSDDMEAYRISSYKLHIFFNSKFTALYTLLYTIHLYSIFLFLDITMMNNTEKRDIITKEFAGGRQDPIDETFGSDTGSFIGSDTGSASMIKTSLHLVLDLLLLKDCRPESKKQDKSLRTSTLMLLVQTMML